MVSKPLGWSFQVKVSLLVILLIVASNSTGTAQDGDEDPPYDAVATRLEFRNTAEAPVTFGVIVSGLATVLAAPIGESQSETGHEAEGEIALYYDVWQVALRHRPYGNVFQLMFRSVGRETHSGWFIEYGPQEVVVKSKTNPNQDSTIESGFGGIGFRVASSYGPGISFGWNGEASLVLLDRNQGTLIRHGISVRIPSGLSALVIGMQVRYSSYDWQLNRPSTVRDAQSQIGLALMLQYGLNSEY